MDFLQNDVFRSLGIATIIALPEIAKWYLPIIYPMSPLDHLERTDNDLGIRSDTHTAVVTITRTASMLRPVTTTLTKRSTVLRTQTDTTTETTTSTMFSTMYNILTDTVTTTSTSFDGKQYVTQFSGFEYAAAVPQSTFSHVWCDETDVRDAVTPCATRSTPTLALSSELSPTVVEYGPDLRDVLLLFCVSVIVTLIYVIRRRTGQPWMLEELEKVKNLNKHLKTTSKELHEMTQKSRSLESRLKNETKLHYELQEARRQMLERAKKIFRGLTTVKVAALKEPEDVFNLIYAEAKSSRDSEKSIFDNIRGWNEYYATEIERLKLVIRERDAEITRIKLHDGQGDLREFQLSLDVRDRAIERAVQDNKREMDKSKAEIRSLTRERDNFKATMDAYKDHIDQHRLDQEKMATLQSQHHTAIQTATEIIQSMQGTINQHQSEKLNIEEEVKTLRNKVSALDKDLANAQQTTQAQMVISATANSNINDAPVEQESFTPTWLLNPSSRRPSSSEGALFGKVLK
ncbi:hypothetical protein T440DRAFT_486056 [Plenodomus tracheiphilus IPT5]|uniref:Uncharacterized protein n=1 Tax=Plenodomus tracheiphilus IPT5 TaxID=1408161 RepID=A0A6A7BI11_9PLEO|nr:hypothetical protein T440DRAFT_486056 [Plenodomus tracheiphilus IPT5]